MEQNNPKRRDILALLGASVGAASLSACAHEAGANVMTNSHQAGLAHIDPDHDPLVWLEEVEGERSLTWVRAQNARSLGILESDPRYAGLNEAALAIVRATDRLTFGGYADGYVVNFWQDANAVRGIWRRAPFDSWRSGDPSWETILDFDALARAEGKNWVNKGANALDPNDYWHTRTMIALSDGGKDATVEREFDMATRQFVAGGFMIPEAKSDVTWVDGDHLLVGTDWGAGSLTDSGYPNVVKLLKRGDELSAAREIFRGQTTDVSSSSFRIDDGEKYHLFLNRSPTFFTSEVYYLGADFTPRKLSLPEKHSLIGLRAGQLYFSLQQDWAIGGQTHKSGDILVAPLAGLLGDGPLHITTIHQLSAREAVQSVTMTKSGLVTVLSQNVRSVVKFYPYGGGAAVNVDLPLNGVADIADSDIRTDKVFYTYNDFLTPPSVLMADGVGATPQSVQAQAARFDASDLMVEQFESTSKDGTKVPYFVVRKKNVVFNGQTPTLLYGYGGFEVSMLPNYSAYSGKMWLERGGAYVLANVRGGGEFGPEWHEAGRKGNRQRIYDDFISVAEDIIAKGLTSTRRLGIMGGSNGGLLMGVMLTQRPDLWRAVVVQVPLLDMLRYHHLLAGASWIDEYGNPDVPAERPFLEHISPYHNLVARPDMPEPLFVTSTKDDRVHPGHARKFAARMESLGLPFYYYENIDGGHSAAANLVESAHRRAVEFTYLTRKLMD